MVRSYMRHGPTQAFGIICSPTAESFFDGKLAFVPGWEDVLVWDVKRGEMVSMWHSTGVTSPITSIIPSPHSPSSSTPSRTYAVSYNDGSIRLWSFTPSLPSNTPTEVITFNGHKKSITTMTFSLDGTRLASGGTEGEIVIWDRIAEVGLFRLKSHRGPITGLRFIPSRDGGAGWLISVAKDGWMKIWDLATQHCVQTVVVGRGECLAMDIYEEKGEVADDGEESEGRWVVLTGGGDGEGKVWELRKEDLDKGLTTSNGELPTLIRPLCTLPLPASQHPITQITFHPTQPLILLQTSDRAITALRLRSVEEVESKRARRKKREREKGKKKGEDGAGHEVDDAAGEVRWEERVTGFCVVRANAKIKSFSLAEEEPTSKGGISLLLALSNNSLETYILPPVLAKKSKSSDPQPEPTKSHSIDLAGHRNDIRTLAISSDDGVIASAANGTLKIWNSRTTSCLRTMECGYAICSTFLPGDRHIVVGTKSGELMLYDIAASSLLSTCRAHTGPIWSIHVRPDGKGLVSGSADKDVKFWEFEMREEGEGEKVVSRLGVETVFKTKQLALVHVRTLKMTDDVLAVRYSPDGRLLAVALLDTTVKIFLQDTLKFFLSLYGHKLPVLSLDISHDSRLLITSSADKNIKIWGLDFGDCHRSIFAHDDSIMQVAFEKDSHYFWSVGKDRTLKYWDADKFELIQKLEGHHGEIWALAVSNKSAFVVTGSHDKSIRIWEKTDEPLLLDEERERELEQMYDTTDTSRPLDPNAEGAHIDEVEGVRKETVESLMAGERIMEAIELADADLEDSKAYEEGGGTGARQRDGRLVAGNVGEGVEEVGEYVRGEIRRVPNASLEDAMLVLPFRGVVSLLTYLDSWARAGKDIPLTSRLIHLILQTHSSQLISTRTLRPMLLDLRLHLREALGKEREKVGYNIAGLRYLKGRWLGDRVAGLGAGEELEDVKGRMGKKGKRKRVIIG